MVCVAEDMLVISATEAWKTTHPGTVIGLLEFSALDNRQPSQCLDERKRTIEASLRERYYGFNRQDFLSLPVMAAYNQYYRKFNKTYHVLLQLESIVKGKNLPNVSPLVDASFAAEVDTLVLTAGHDVDTLKGAITMDVAREGDTFIQMGGSAKTIPPGDMVMRDESGLLCSILYGQDNISPITPKTTQALYVSYAPAGVPLVVVQSQLRQIEEHIRLFSPSAVVEQCRLVNASA
jgi:DNA/RNA-binding domain of Phe-tRNA-synthetase-like protein